MDYRPCSTGIFFHNNFDFSNEDADDKRKWKSFVKGGAALLGGYSFFFPVRIRGLAGRV